MTDIATRLKRPGAVGVIPTDTLYGLVARAADEAAVTRLYNLKHRERKPGTVIAADIDQLQSLGIKRRYLKAVEQFWPGPISVVIPVSDPGLEYLHCSKQSLAVRLPEPPSLKAILKQTGPLLTSSANLPGQPPAQNLAEAKAYFDNNIDFYEDGGDLSGRQPSTVIQIVDDAIEVLRQGAGKVG